ncbi:hypothetical protein NKR23_g10416 [Pleurostoma richardsiae]|uniref:CENP-V/GFA domain-containing protein n=1 Tax=Pleurostoma richardsiae TaxID=41990 RepID=A0AA38VBX0_9PEZI|nr:hypothetical protein NKR23_g10416 [Pleurostoma richardsiae]
MSADTPHSAGPPFPHYTDNPSAFPMEGGCACGAIRYRLEVAPLAVHCCHCTSCQRETGTAFAINSIVEAKHLTALPPAPATVPAHPGEPDIFLPAGPPPPGAARKPRSPEVPGEVASPVAPSLFLTPSESGEGQTIARCPRCAVAVWSEYGGGPAVRFLRGGTLDRAWLVAPDLHIYTRSMRCGVLAPVDGRPRFEEYYDRRTVWRPDSMARYQEVLPQIMKYREELEKRRGERERVEDEE